MRDLTFTELDLEIAEQLPARELMGKSPCGPPAPPHGPAPMSGGIDNHSANGNGNWGLINVGNGAFSGNNVVLVGGGGGGPAL